MAQETSAFAAEQYGFSGQRHGQRNEWTTLGRFSDKREGKRWRTFIIERRRSSYYDASWRTRYAVHVHFTELYLCSVGLCDTDLHMISIVDNPALNGGLSDDSSQSSAAPITGLVQPQQPHWPQHHIASNNPQHLKNYILDGDDDMDEFDYDEYSNGGRSDTPGDPSSPMSSTVTRSKRSASNKRNSQTGSKKVSSNGLNGGTPGASSGRRQQYTLAELPYVCDFCQARYKTKPGLHYHLAKHKEANTDHRPAVAAPDNSRSSLSPTSMNGGPAYMKQKYPNAPMDPQHQPYPMYPHPGGPGVPGYPNYMNGAPGMPPSGPYPMPPQQHLPYGMPPHPHPHGMPPSASMPLTVAALSGSSPAGGMPGYPPQQQSSSKPPPAVSLGSQCDFCAGDEHENKTTKLPEQMITCKVNSREIPSLLPTGRHLCFSRIVEVRHIQPV